MFSEDITFCANKDCYDMKCKRNSKHIKLNIYHSFGLFTQCKKWTDKGAEWLTNQIEDWPNFIDISRSVYMEDK